MQRRAGRYAVRTGATQPDGMTLWEVTIAEALKSAGYATALYGKWHLGGNRPEGRREPSHQRVDEYYARGAADPYEPPKRE
jgi:arylsulfatase A-like enzyme